MKNQFEKAHPQFFDLLLQVLGEGRLTDAGGRLADFRNSVIIMTSNLGTDSIDRGLVGFGRMSNEAARAEDHFIHEVQQYVRPEFFNRIDRIIPFQALDPGALRQIAQRELDLLRQREGIRYRNIDLHFSDAVTNEVLRLGYEPRYGARPLKRAIDRHLLAPLSEVFNQRAWDAPLRVEVDVVDGHITPKFSTGKVQIESHATSRDPADETATQELIEQLLEQRRWIQRIDQSWAVTKMRNEMDRLQRLEERKKPSSVSLLLSLGPLGGLEDLQQFDQRIKTLFAEAAQFEDEWLTSFYAGTQIDREYVEMEFQTSRDGLRGFMIDLYTREFVHSDSTTIAIYGNDPAWLFRLAATYHAVAQRMQHGIKMYKIIRLQSETPRTRGSIRLGDLESRAPEKVKQANGNNLQAFPIMTPERFLRGGDEEPVVGIGLCLRGRAVSPLFQDEDGIHRLLDGSNKKFSCLVHQSDKSMWAYQPPKEIERWRDLKGNTPRRIYQRQKNMIVDKQLEKTVSWRRSLPDVLIGLLQEHFDRKMMGWIES